MRNVRLIPIRRFLLWLALGPRTYDYMSRVLREDHRLRTCRMADIVVRKDGKERRIEADWLKTMATIVIGRWSPPGGWPKPLADERHGAQGCEQTSIGATCPENHSYVRERCSGCADDEIRMLWKRVEEALRSATSISGIMGTEWPEQSKQELRRLRCVLEGTLSPESPR